MYINHLRKVTFLTLLLVSQLIVAHSQESINQSDSISNEINATKTDSSTILKKPWFVFNIFPNPNNGEFCIEFENMTPSLQVNIYDVSGKRVKTVYNVIKRNEISLSNCPSGIYVLKVSDEKQVKTRQIVIAR
jgi:hypothetical protein